MTSLYKQTIPVFIKYLNGMKAMLAKGARFADETPELGRAKLLEHRLIADMRGLPYQVQSCSNTAKFLAVRVGGLADEYLEDNETTFEQLEDRVDRTIKILERVDPKAMDGMEDKEIIMETKMGNFKFTGYTYVSEYAIPNFHFHLSSAYCIMRQQGVPLGVFDYLKDVFHKE